MACVYGSDFKKTCMPHMPSMALIATEQVIHMVEQKLHEAKLKK